MSRKAKIIKSVILLVHASNEFGVFAIFTLFTLAILCLAIDILEYVLNWREHRGQTGANHKRISCSEDSHEFISYTRMTTAT